MPGARTLVFLSFPVLCIAWDKTHFELYKNTHFGPCPTTAPVNATVPIPDSHQEIGTPWTWMSSSTNASLSADAFCDRFWNYTVLPSTPLDGAFSISWLNVVINVFWWIIGAVNLHVVLKKQESGPRYEFSPVAMEEGVKKKASFRKRLWRWILAIKFWVLLLYTLATTILWWDSFLLIIRNPNTSHALLSPVAVLSLLGYFITFREDIAERYYVYVPWGFIVVVPLQLVAGAIALGVFAKTHGKAPEYAVLPSFDLSAFNCDVNALLFDPTNHTFDIFVYASPILLAYALFTLGFFAAACVCLHILVVSKLLRAIYAVLAFCSSLSFFFVAFRRTNPIAWDPDCALVHVMMGSGRGYLDVRAEDMWEMASGASWRIVKTFSAIYW